MKLIAVFVSVTVNIVIAGNIAICYIKVAILAPPGPKCSLAVPTTLVAFLSFDVPDRRNFVAAR